MGADFAGRLQIADCEGVFESSATKCMGDFRFQIVVTLCYRGYRNLLTLSTLCGQIARHKLLSPLPGRPPVPNPMSFQVSHLILKR